MIVTVFFAIMLVLQYACCAGDGHHRSVHSIHDCPETRDGADVVVYRCVGSDRSRGRSGDDAGRGPLDPLLVFDVYQATSREQFAEGFPAHPHRGFLEIRYVIGGACLYHEDSCGTTGLTCPGSAQGLFAGRGIAHEEVISSDGLAESANSFRGFQLWVNVPRHVRQLPPKYLSRAVPILRDAPDAKSIGVVAGRYRGTDGAMYELQASVGEGGVGNPFLVLDVTLPGEGEATGVWTIDISRANHLSLYIIAGCVEVQGTRVLEGNFAVTGPGDAFACRACSRQEARFLLSTGERVKEATIVAGGFVASSIDEIETCYKELENGDSTHC